MNSLVSTCGALSADGFRYSRPSRIYCNMEDSSGKGEMRSSSAEYCLRIAKRMSLMTCSADAFPIPDFYLIFAPLKDYDELEILRS